MGRKAVAQFVRGHVERQARSLQVTLEKALHLRRLQPFTLGTKDRRSL